jgi:hypothetical protein
MHGVHVHSKCVSGATSSTFFVPLLKYRSFKRYEYHRAH